MAVMAKTCDQCLLSTAKVVGDVRRDEILEMCNRTHQAFECHKSTIAGGHAVCRAFYDQSLSLSVRLAKMLDRAIFVDVE